MSCNSIAGYRGYRRGAGANSHKRSRFDYQCYHAQEGEWRASKLAGIDAYNEENEKIGDINEMILDRSGKVANVIQGVGGVLGLGDFRRSRSH